MLSTMWLIMLGLLHVFDLVYTDGSMCLANLVTERRCPNCCYGHALITDNTTRSVTECSRLCSMDLGCQSFQFNPRNNTCQTNAEKMKENVNNNVCEDFILYGEFKKATCRGYWLSGPCSNDNDCLVGHSSCVDDRCECNPGYRYVNRTDSCQPGCDRYGDTFYEVPNYIVGLDNDTLMGIDIQQCKAACRSNEKFVCRMVEFRDFSDTTECSLSEFNTITAPSGSDIMASDSFDKQFERNCA